MTDVSLNFREYAYYQESGVFPILLMTMDHNDFASPILLSSDPTQRLVETAADIVYGTISNSIEYYFFPCKLVLPHEKQDSPGRMKMQFDNINQDYVVNIRQITGPVSMQVDMVMSNAVDSVERSWPEFLLRHVQYDAGIISGTMELEGLESEPYPGGSFLPMTSPAIF